RTRESSRRGATRFWSSWNAPLVSQIAPVVTANRQTFQHFHRRLPTNARVGYALAVTKSFPSVDDFLTSFGQMTLQHQATNRARPFGNLVRHVACHDRLTTMVLAAVTVAAIHHQSWRQSGSNQHVGGG